MFINEILLALAASGSGVLRLTEGQLIDLASGGGQSTQMLNAFLSSNFDTTDVSRPHAYWTEQFANPYLAIHPDSLTVVGRTKRKEPLRERDLR